MSAHRSPRGGHGGEVAELARLLPVPAERDLPDERMLLLREHLMGELHAGRGRGAAGRTAHASGTAGPGRAGGPRWAGQPEPAGEPGWTGERRPQPEPGRAGGPDRRGRPGRGREPWWRIGMAGGVAAAGAAALAAALAVGGVSTLGRSSGPSPYPTSFTSGTDPAGPGGPAGPTGPIVRRSAARLLSQVAGAAAVHTPVVANNRQFAYIESQVSFGSDGAPAPAQTHERQIWLPVADWCAGGLLIEHGQRTSLKFPSSGVSYSPGNGAPATPVREKCPDPGSLGDPTYRLFQSLPTDPRVLLHRIRQLNHGGRSPDAVAFGAIGDLIRESVMPPRVAAALYRAAALIPGTVVISVATDAIGRPGVAVSLSVRGDQQEWIFDRHTLLLLGEREFMHGILVGKTAILDRTIVDRAGELPPGG